MQFQGCRPIAGGGAEGGLDPPSPTLLPTLPPSHGSPRKRNGKKMYQKV